MAWSSREVVSQLQLLCCPEVLELDWDTLGDSLKGMVVSTQQMSSGG